MSKAKAKQRQEKAKQKAIKNADRLAKRELERDAGGKVFYGERKDKLVEDLGEIDVSDDKALAIGLFSAFGLPVPDDLTEKYDIKPSDLPTHQD